MTDPTHSRFKELEEIVSLDPADPKREEALRSIRLRNLLRQYEQFMAGADAPAQDVADALARLSATDAAPLRSAPRKWPRVALAMAAILVVAVGLRSGMGVLRSETPQVRSTAAGDEFRAEVSWSADGRLDLVWPLVEGATAYELKIFDPSLTVRARLDLPLSGRASVDLENFSLGEDLAVQIVASGASGELQRTRLQPLPVR